MLSKRVTVGALLALTILLAGCRDDLPKGSWISIYEPHDRIEILGGGTARLTALRGQTLDVWYPIAPAQTELGKQFDEARRALAQFDMVDTAYEVNRKSGTVIFRSDTRGSRTLALAGDDMLDDPDWALRTYLWQKR